MSQLAEAISTDESLKPNRSRSGRPRNEDYSVPPEPVLTPMYGVRSFIPTTTCDQIHPFGPIPKGSSMYCEVCSDTGKRDHPVFRKTARDRNGDVEWPKHGAPTKYNPDGVAGGTGPLDPSTINKLTKAQKRAIAATAARVASEST